MASKSLLTIGAKVNTVEQLYYVPVVVLPQNTDIPLASIYCVLAKPLPWANEENPPEPTQDRKYLKQFQKNIFVAKKINSNDISPVITRVDWTYGTTYDYYVDDQDMFDGRTFYVKNRYDQVFKCLWNGNGDISTDEPYFEPGSYGNNNIYIGSDGYKWKYMYTIDTGSKVKFMDANWMPIPVSESDPNPLLADAGYGNIDVINVTDGGESYNTTVTVTITI